MQDPLNNAGVFLITTLFDLYLFVLMIRLILVWVRADYFNPLSQFIVKLTNPIIIPLRRILPNIGRLETSTLVALLVFDMLKFGLVDLITYGAPHIIGLIILSFADALKILLNTFFYAILLQAILSWVQPGGSPITSILFKLTSPIIRPIQRVVPPIGGIDISPIPALILLQLLSILLIAPLFSVGLRMTLG